MTTSTITASNMFTPLLSADRFFRLRWEEFEAEWGSETDPPYYLALSSLAEHLIERLGAGETGSFGAVFKVVEQWHIRGDTYVAEAASMGLLESIQNALGGQDRGFRSPNGVRASDFERWLGPISRQWWDKLYLYWNGDSTTIQPDR
ncbi:hypothetical protein U1769_00505 [Sphingomonas sp. ZT3P38]|uniref:DUF7674 family protein n=1 Tax=Parasphingomonas zepuensis TaxID=3096161 RepID=UPI002FCA22E2